MRAPLLIAVALVAISCSCAKVRAPAPPGSLDDLFVQIVNTDPQTAGQWSPPEAMTAPPEYVRAARRTATIYRVDLDGDHVDEAIVSLNVAWINRPDNKMFYVVKQYPDGWRLVGEIGGKPKIILGAGDHEMKTLRSDWWIGGAGKGENVEETYEFRDGHYELTESKSWYAVHDR
jgi:hypothetical protein